MSHRLFHLYVKFVWILLILLCSKCFAIVCIYLILHDYHVLRVSNKLVNLLILLCVNFV